MVIAEKEVQVYDFDQMMDFFENNPPMLVTEGDVAGKDSSNNPFAEGNPAVGNTKKYAWPPLAQDLIDWTELWWTSFTPKGFFITWLSSRFALKSGWNHVTHKKAKTPVNNSLNTFLTKIKKEFQLKQIYQEADALAKIFGRALVSLETDGPDFYYTKPFLRVYIIRDIDIDYDDKGDVLYYRPIVRKGMGQVIRHINPENTVMFVYQKDPNGNGLQGISALLPNYKTIVRSENVAESYSNLLVQRGMSGIDVKVTGADTEKKLRPYARKFSKWSANSVLTHDENIEIKTLATINSGFNYEEVMSRATKDISSGSGYPSLRVEGLQTGAVTGAQSDQDNTAENYAAEQEMFEPFMIRVYQLIAQKVYNRSIKNFELDFDFDVKMDKSTIANIFQTYANSFSAVDTLITVNQALTRLDFPPADDLKIGEMLLIDYNAKWTEILEPKEETENNPENPDDKNFENEDKEEEEEEENDFADLPEEKKENETDQDGSITKLGMVHRLLGKGKSVRNIQNSLKTFFGSGINNNRLLEIKKSFDSQELMLKTNQINKPIQFLKRVGHGFLINNIYYIDQNTIGFIRRQNEQIPIKIFVRDFLNVQNIDLNTILTEKM